MVQTKHVLDTELGDELLLAKWKRRLAEFTRAAHALDETWDSLESRGIDVGQHAYPFLDHFSDVREGIQIWADTQAYTRLRKPAQNETSLTGSVFVGKRYR
jgi:hypothetical protein